MEYLVEDAQAQGRVNKITVYPSQLRLSRSMIYMRSSYTYLFTVRLPAREKMVRFKSYFKGYHCSKKNAVYQYGTPPPPPPKRTPVGGTAPNPFLPSCPILPLLIVSVPVAPAANPRSQHPQALCAVPDAHAHPRRDLAPPQPLVDEPHAHHKLLLVERGADQRAARAVPVHEVPHLGEFGLGEPAARPNVPNHHVGHVFRGGLVALVAYRW